ncbi:MAG: hypothetical protein JXD23_15850 [Spirochaetales bacterium]|nr:hypothetical protein [Spirochaetales bacterium]
MDVPVNYFFELANIFFVAVFLMVVRVRFKLDDQSILLLFFHFTLIFLTNYFLFSPNYMGDQYIYLFTAQHFRGMDVPFFTEAYKTAATSLFFAYFPMPLLNSIYSIASINFILYVILFLFFRERGVLIGSNRAFYLFYPSLALYSSMALRDPIIFFLMALFLYYLFVRKIVFKPLVLLGIPLFLIKYQNALVIIITLVVFVLLHRRFHPVLKIAILAGCAGGFFLFGSMVTLGNVNKIRMLFYLENNASLFGFNPFASWMDAASYAFSSFFSFLLEPLVWKAENIFQLLQAIENVAIAVILFRVIFKPARGKFRVELASLLFFFILGLLIYSMVIVNSGAGARYRYPFVALFFIFYNYFKTIPEDDDGKIRAGAAGRVRTPYPVLAGN